MTQHAMATASEIANKGTNYGKPKLTISGSADCIAYVVFFLVKLYLLFIE